MCYQILRRNENLIIETKMRKTTTTTASNSLHQTLRRHKKLDHRNKEMRTMFMFCPRISPHDTSKEKPHKRPNPSPLSNKNRTNKTPQVEEPIETHTQQQLDIGAQKTHQKNLYCKLHHFFIILFLEDHPLQCSQYVTLQKCFSHPSLVIYFFGNPSCKTETGTANSKPPGTQTFYYGPIRNTGQQSDHIYYTLLFLSFFLHVQQRCSAFY
jgi:hypothetical protein